MIKDSFTLQALDVFPVCNTCRDTRYRDVFPTSKSSVPYAQEKRRTGDCLDSSFVELIGQDFSHL